MTLRRNIEGRGRAREDAIVVNAKKAHLHAFTLLSPCPFFLSSALSTLSLFLSLFHLFYAAWKTPSQSKNKWTGRAFRLSDNVE
mmetsp:Transcript_24997/g.62936  ORF Transcript_24997/g.62936 Transcript_24997/m.62936 type:complete len:84 (+) Transcript_24997:74-325(+)